MLCCVCVPEITGEIEREGRDRADATREMCGSRAEIRGECSDFCEDL